MTGGPAGGRRWVVDGANVVGSRPDGWWKDRPAAFARLADELGALAGRSGDDITVVFDGSGPHDEPNRAGVAVAWAPSADDRIVELVAADGHPSSLTVVTSDRQLASRVTELGAEVAGAGSFRRHLDSSAATAGGAKADGG